ncbi:MAG TPA: DUF748 domain-containing protein [Steroidobacteraceae bacterium]|nr:DUF748 domain-containing protein [Steroidobacteraceae bacterium]
MAFIKFTRARIIFVAIVVALFCAYTLYGFFGVPRLLHSRATEFVAQEYGRKLDLGDIEFNPFTLVLKVHGLSFPDSEGQPLVGFRELSVDLNVSSLFRLAPSFAAIELEEPFTSLVVRKDGTLNLVDLARPFETAEKEAAEAAEPLKLFIERFGVRSGRIDFEDRARASVFHTRLAPITFELRDFATTGEGGNFYALRAASVDDERFSWDGTFETSPFTSSGRFEIANLRATTLWSYLRDALPFELTSGMINLRGGYDFAARDSGLKLNVADVTATDVALHGPEQPVDDVKLASLQVTNTRFDLRQRRVDVEKLSFSGATLRARRDAQGNMNLLSMFGEDEAVADAPATASGEAAPRWVLSAPDIAIEGASMEVDDGLVKPAAAFRLAPIDVKVAGYSNAPGTHVQLDANVGIDGSGKIAAKGDVALDTAALSLHVDVGDFNLASLQPYLGAYTQMTLSRGSLTAALDVKRSETSALEIAGSVDVTKLHTVDNALKQEFITWDRLRLGGLEYSSRPARLHIATVAANAPYARLIIAPDQSINVSKVLSAPSGSMPAPIQTVAGEGNTRVAPPPRVSIGAVRIVNGAANFADFWIQPNYAVNLQNMNGSILGLSSDPKSRARVQFEGKVDRYAPAKIDGDINLLSAALYTDLKVSFKGVEMTSVTPYSGRFAGYKIEKGKLSIDVAYLVENRTLTARQRFVIDQLELGERVESEDAVRLPLKLAVALLKDRNGVIDIDLPMTGSLDDPQFRMGPLIWKAFVGLISKAATAPFALLGSLFGGGEEMNIIEFEAGSAALDAAAQEKIVSITQALIERPGLQLDIPTTYAPELDSESISARRLEGLLRSLPRADDAALADPAQRFELLVTQYRADFGGRSALPPAALALNGMRKSDRTPEAIAAANLELEQAVVQKHAVTDTDLEQLGQSRARAIQDALLGAGTLDATRVFILGANPSAPAANRKVRLELSLK